MLNLFSTWPTATSVNICRFSFSLSIDLDPLILVYIFRIMGAVRQPPGNKLKLISLIILIAQTTALVLILRISRTQVSLCYMIKSILPYLDCRRTSLFIFYRSCKCRNNQIHYVYYCPSVQSQ